MTPHVAIHCTRAGRLFQRVWDPTQGLGQTHPPRLHVPSVRAGVACGLERLMKRRSGLPSSLAFFNNKGGVGKTTLSCNMASLIAEKTQASVLYVDCDPQCNATQLLLTESEWGGLYRNKKRSVDLTLLRAFRHIRIGDSGIITDLHVQRSARFGIDVLAGHPNLSTLEDMLSASWVDFKAGALGAARRSLWARYLVDSLQYDLIVFDLGPSLGALNRTVLLGCESFVTPMAADLFSLYALDNIAEWMAAWMRDYRRAGLELKTSDPDAVEEWTIDPEPPIARGFRGYTVQQYVSRSSGGGIREVKAYDRYKLQIPKRVTALNEWTPPGLKPDLGVVPNMFSMVPLAQSVHAPITRLTSGDGLRGAQIGQQEKYSQQLHALADRLLLNLALT
jgi:cellulose biosynthesis protein BcsQ